MKIRTILVEDEINAQKSIIRLINKWENLELIAICEGVDEAITAYNKESPDLLLLDVDLKDGTAFDFLNHYENLEAQVIFTTGDINNAAKAIKSWPFHYLNKPILKREFDEAIKRLINFFKKENYTSFNKKELPSKFFFPTRNGKRPVKVNDIQWLHADKGCVEVHQSKSQEKVVVNKNLPWFEERLDTSIFLRIHRNSIINVDKISEILKHGANVSIILENGIEVDVSRSNVPKINSLLDY